MSNSIKQLMENYESARKALFIELSDRVYTLGEEIEDVLKKLTEKDDGYSEYEMDYRINTDGSYSDYYNVVTDLVYKDGSVCSRTGVWDSRDWDYGDIEIPEEANEAIAMIEYMEKELINLQRQLEELCKI
ncbi:MAG: hypothetical protein ACRC5M_00700 [Anaeroplasmataceae bacterium]